MGSEMCIRDSKLVYLSQGDSVDLLERARGAAAQLELEFEHVVTGYGQLEESLIRVASPTP